MGIFLAIQLLLLITLWISWGIILKKIGYTWLWVIPCIIPLVMIPAVWVLAFKEWPKFKKPSKKSKP